MQPAANTRPVYGVLLEHFTVDGGSPSIGTGVTGILLRSNGGRVHQVHVHNMSGHATSSQFTINVNAAPGAATATFAWTAAIQ